MAKADTEKVREINEVLGEITDKMGAISIQTKQTLIQGIFAGVTFAAQAAANDPDSFSKLVKILSNQPDLNDKVIGRSVELCKAMIESLK